MTYMVRNLSTSMGTYRYKNEDYFLKPKEWTKLDEKPSLVSAELNLIEIK